MNLDPLVLVMLVVFVVIVFLAFWIKTILDEKNKQILELSSHNTTFQIRNATLEAELKAQKEGNQKLKDDLDEQGKKLELKLNAIMEHNLESKLKKLDETSIKSLDTLLKPFKENLDSFKKSVENSQEHSTKKFAELSKEIELVARTGLSIGREAENLTKALKGKKQSQGSWGEMILESVLEYSGLIKGIHYETQESYKDEEGRTKRPDVVIKLPQERTIIIDSKVSLNSYDEFIRAESDEEKLIASKNLASAFLEHINTLDSKDYAHYKHGTLQYVFMFVPIEGAFSVAIQQEPKLYEHALKKHIAIVTPSTLTISLRTIYLYWQSEQSSTLATKLFEEAGKMYDKMTNFAESFKKIGTQLQTLSGSYDNAHKQLTEGSGNILGRVENLKRLGAKATKNLKDAKLEYQDFNTDIEEVRLLDQKEE
ncbi:MAG: DNA recombination protein RmuC [Campylobacteraceae bacterium]|nr:DNA recombination protein RmuC [Campylobacteraceae bacterium]